MSELLAILAPILVVDVLNPVLFAILVFAAGSSRPVANSSAMLLGHTLAYFVAGVIVALGLDQVAERLANPQQLDFAVGGVIGVLLLWLTFKTRRDGPAATDEPTWQLTPLKCMGLGAVVNFVGIPFALPYFAAVDQILKADLSTTGSLTALAIYNGGYMLLFSIVPLAVAIAGDSAKPLLDKINDILVKASEAIMPWLIFLLGAWFIVDAGFYFIVGKPIF
jgi:threonine/homoserine/homoserine lactone efflux protein